LGVPGVELWICVVCILFLRFVFVQRFWECLCTFYFPGHWDDCGPSLDHKLGCGWFGPSL